MGDQVTTITVQLRRPVTLQTANNHRQELNQSFAKLSPDEAVKLLESILTFDRARLPYDFRRLDRAVRLELMLRLAASLGTQTSAQILSRLTSARPSPEDEILQKGLRIVFPNDTRASRDKFLEALRHGPAKSMPQVTLEFRAGDQDAPSADNQCRICQGASRLIPATLGIDLNSGLNWMEIRGIVMGHRPDAQYRFDRTVAVGRWYFANKSWKCLDFAKAGTKDNTSTADEDSRPDNDHIYSVDGPGFTSIPPELYAIRDKAGADVVRNVTEFVFMMNAIETVEVKVGKGQWQKVAQLDWFSVTWLDKPAGSNWRRTPGRSKIAKGSIDDLDIAADQGIPPEAY